MKYKFKATLQLFCQKHISGLRGTTKQQRGLRFADRATWTKRWGTEEQGYAEEFKADRNTCAIAGIAKKEKTAVIAVLTLWSEEVPHFTGTVREAITAHETAGDPLTTWSPGKFVTIMCTTKNTNFLGASKQDMNQFTISSSIFPLTNLAEIVSIALFKIYLCLAREGYC